MALKKLRCSIKGNTNFSYHHKVLLRILFFFNRQKIAYENSIHVKTVVYMFILTPDLLFKVCFIKVFKVPHNLEAVRVVSIVHTD